MYTFDIAGVADVIPGRAKVTRRKLTMNSLSVRTADQDWLNAAHPSEEQKKKLIGLILIIGTYLIMSNHTFMVGDEVFRQTYGGPIGLQFTGSIARVVMMIWDSTWRRLLH